MHHESDQRTLGSVPVIDLAPWFEGDQAERQRVAGEVDDALQETGFLLVTGHGVPSTLIDDVRAAARRFFALPVEVKERYGVEMGGRGWLPSGRVRAGNSEGKSTPPDLKETFVVGAEEPVGHPVFDKIWFKPNAYPGEVPELEPLLVDYLARMRGLTDDLLQLCAAALGLPIDFFTSRSDHPSYTMNVNWYPSLSALAEPEPGQFRIGEHTDFGTLTIIDRQDGLGGLQVHTPDGDWVNAPHEPGSFTVNVGDLLARWTGGRWQSSRHRVLPPDPNAPDEELVSLIYFNVANPGARIESLPAPIGRVEYEPVGASDYILEKVKLVSQGHAG